MKNDRKDKTAGNIYYTICLKSYQQICVLYRKKILDKGYNAQILTGTAKFFSNAGEQVCFYSYVIDFTLFYFN